MKNLITPVEVLRHPSNDEARIVYYGSERREVPDDAGEEPIIRFIGTDISEDRYGSVIEPAGWDIDPYMRSGAGVFCFGHNYGIPTVGKTIKLEKNSKRMIFTVRFAVEHSEFAKQIYGLVKDDYMPGTSVGFIPKKWEEYESKTVSGYFAENRKYLEQELLELSSVPVPANRNSLKLAVSRGVVTDNFMDELMNVHPALKRMIFGELPSLITGGRAHDIGAMRGGDMLALVTGINGVEMVRQQREDDEQPNPEETEIHPVETPKADEPETPAETPTETPAETPEETPAAAPKEDTPTEIPTETETKAGHVLRMKVTFGITSEEIRSIADAVSELPERFQETAFNKLLERGMQLRAEGDAADGDAVAEAKAVIQQLLDAGNADGLQAIATAAENALADLDANADDDERSFARASEIIGGLKLRKGAKLSKKNKERIKQALDHLNNLEGLNDPDEEEAPEPKLVGKEAEKTSTRLSLVATLRNELNIGTVGDGDSNTDSPKENANGGDTAPAGEPTPPKRSSWLDAVMAKQ